MNSVSHYSAADSYIVSDESSADESLVGESSTAQACPQKQATRSPGSLSAKSLCGWLFGQHMLAFCLLVSFGISAAGACSAGVEAGFIEPSRALSFLQWNSAGVVVGSGLLLFAVAVSHQIGLNPPKSNRMGAYKLIRRIGSGGMGEVYLAEHELLRRHCAIKLIRSDKSSNRKMLGRFEREVKATAQLTHWNTVQVFDYGCTENGTFYYVMEYLQGLNLRQLVEEHGALPPGRVVFILRQICGTLHEAAVFGLVHRDIKPNNIFLTERGQMFDVAKLLDFGLVRPTSLGVVPLRTVNRQLDGSPRYMCPEQARGQQPDCRGDLYSLACVAYYLLTGRAPFEDENPVTLVVSHVSVEPPSFAEIGVDIPADLEAAIRRCLKKDPEERFRTPRAFQEALDRCECAFDWSWAQAEDWWLEQPEQTQLRTVEAGSTASRSSRTDLAFDSDPDMTFVCSGRGPDESHA